MRLYRIFQVKDGEVFYLGRHPQPGCATDDPGWTWRKWTWPECWRFWVSTEITTAIVVVDQNLSHIDDCDVIGVDWYDTDGIPR
jgi:hypothetical protein